MINKETAERIIKVLTSDCEDSDLFDVFKKEFDDDNSWYIYYLASTWYNDLQGWCEMIVAGQSEKDFFIETDNEMNEPISI
jgi:hypothetical protein